MGTARQLTAISCSETVRSSAGAEESLLEGARGDGVGQALAGEPQMTAGCGGGRDLLPARPTGWPGIPTWLGEPARSRPVDRWWSG